MPRTKADAILQMNVDRNRTLSHTYQNTKTYGPTVLRRAAVVGAKTTYRGAKTGVRVGVKGVRTGVRVATPHVERGYHSTHNFVERQVAQIRTPPKPNTHSKQKFQSRAKKKTF